MGARNTFTLSVKGIMGLITLVCIKNATRMKISFSRQVLCTENCGDICFAREVLVFVLQLASTFTFSDTIVFLVSRYVQYYCTCLYVYNVHLS